MKYNFKNSRVTVVGMARSGLAAALLLKRLGAKATVIDRQYSPQIAENRDRLLAEGINALIKAEEKSFLDRSDIIVVSPGVNEACEFIKLAKRKKIPVISELELGFQNCLATIIAVTGTNGKTTVTTLIGEALKANARNVFVCGNIGNAFCNYALDAKKDDFIVLEVSSFQLEKIDEFRPKISLFLNFTPDHLDRYKSIDDYLTAKKRIFLNQKESDWAVLNFKDNIARSFANELTVKVIFFNKPQKNNIRLRLNPNQQAVMAVVNILKLDENICLDLLANFKGIKHRMEFVRSISNIDFINDSKATNVDSAKWGLEQATKPVLLIAGGRDKGSNLKEIKGLIKKKVKLMLVIGEAREKFFEAFINDLPVIKADSLEEATKVAYQKAESGDCVMLSPMCASFDMFRDYEDRGEQFKQLVESLKEKP
ncbi:MAG: UDP-N-acetylmuramoyl-L-alanine--D-glutamate ligase [Candidatus Omnitrophota bacterium]